MLKTALMVAVPRLASVFGFSQRSKKELFDLLYGLDWGETTTNNYGFAPAEGKGAECYQLQMYTELDKRLRSHMAGERIQSVLEVSCGRSGGLDHLAQSWEVPVRAVGLDWSRNALRFCASHYGNRTNLTFVRGNALQLPFASESFDVVINVEAAGDYGDDAGFFGELYRVLRPQGLFLYADARRANALDCLKNRLHRAGFSGSLEDITQNVALVCEQDSERRRELIRKGVPWYYRMLIGERLSNYAAIKGTKRLARFQDGRKIYVMGSLQKAASERLRFKNDLPDYF